MLAIILRLLTFLAAVYLLHRLIRVVFSGQITGHGGAKKQGEVIDICPKCGLEIKFGHVCRKL